jgi:hypothetical protein
MRRRNIHTLFQCADCNAVLAVRGGFFSRWNGGDWCMVKDSVWRRGQRSGKCRFLCVGCLERRIGRKLSAGDFKRSAKVNFEAGKSAKLRSRMRGLKTAKRLVVTTFKRETR